MRRAGLIALISAFGRASLDMVFSIPLVDPPERSLYQPYRSLAREVVGIPGAVWSGRDTDGRRFGVGEDQLETVGQLLARRAVRRRQAVSENLFRSEHIHVDMDVNHIGQAAQAFHLGSYVL